MEDKLMGRVCNFGQKKPDGTLFWRRGKYLGEDATHFLFEIEGKEIAFLRTEIARIEWGVV
jgi:hypothetical protein